jgi:hypothetical protein
LRYQFRAPAETTAAELEAFLQRVGREAQRIGFASAAVVDVQFHIAERARVARWLLGGRPLVSERSTRPKPVDMMRYITKNGATLPPPLGGVLLIVADESGDEARFGFMRYPESIQTADGSMVVESGLGRNWFFEDFVESPDARCRLLLQMFVEEGFPTNIADDFLQNDTA